MGHTNSTANLSLPQFIGTDKPTWLGDINGAFSAIDAYAGTNDAAVSAAASDASSAISQASAAVNTANTANTTAGNASTTANNAIGVANTANAIAGTVDAKVGLLADLNTTDRTSIVNAINEVDGVAKSRTIATAAANQTYAAQATALNTAFQALSDDEKLRCVIKSAGVIHQIENIAGSFSYVFLTASNYIIETVKLNTANVYAYASATDSYTDNSSNVNTDAMELILI